MYQNEGNIMSWGEGLKIFWKIYIQFGLQDLEIQERVYSADKPLPDRLQHKSEYSIGRLVKQAARWGSKQMTLLISSPESAHFRSAVTKCAMLWTK